MKCPEDNNDCFFEDAEKDLPLFTLPGHPVSQLFMRGASGSQWCWYHGSWKKTGIIPKD